MADNERVWTIDGKEYKDSELSLDVRNTLVARQEILQSRIRHEVELEKIQVLENYYNDKIKKEIEKINGGDSKSND
jgi:hypothetical protein